MSNAIIGALRVSLGMDSAQFQSGAKNATRSLEGMKTTMIAVSAAMAAVGAAAFALVNSVSNTGVQIARQASVANTSARDFQRMAVAAKTVGIENDKLADILKDVNDRVGDFLTTGGGPMADFFEKIAPKVGVTAEQFKNLSGADSLRLFVSSLEAANLSQAEMTFYMEAMASDATALIPLLANGGAEIERLGDAAESTGAIMSDKAVANSQEFRAALNRLSLGAEGLRNTIAERLMPIFTDLINMVADRILPAIDSVINGVSEWMMWFQLLPDPVKEAAGIIAAALGIGGPILVAIEVLKVAFVGLVASSGPIGLFIAAAALVTAAWVTWGDDIKAAIGPAVAWVGEKFDWLMQKISAVIGMARDMATGLRDAFSFGASGPNLIPSMSEIIEQQSAIGNAMGQGLANGVTQSGAAQEIQDYLNSIPEQAKTDLGIQSPSRVFAEIGRFLSEGLGLGITQGAGAVSQAMDEVVGETTLAMKKAEGQLASLKSSAQQAFTGFVTGALSAKQAAKNLLSSLAQILANKAFDSLLGGLFSGGGFIGKLFGANANGTKNWGGGLSMVGERGPELVNLPRGSQVYDAQKTQRMMGDGVAEVRVTGGDLVLTDSGQIAARIKVTSQQAGSQAVQMVKSSLPGWQRQLSNDGTL